jgi:hypothetical protein
VLHPRNLLILAGLLLILIGGWWSWRATQPKLTDEQQIAANIEDIRRNVESRNARYIASYFARGFSANGNNRGDVQNEMAGAFLQWRDVTANITGLQISISGDTATTSGKYSLAYKPHPRAHSETALGDFKASWKKEAGAWKISSIDGTVPQE